jgi:hypothetical protein
MMRRRRNAACAALLGLGLLGGCASQASGGASATVLDEHANNTTVRVQAGQEVKLLLHSTYWMDLRSSQPTVVRADGAPKVLPATTQCVPGGGCAPVEATFTAASAGTAVLSASRTSCGEALACSPADSRYRVTIVVEAH